MFAVLVLVKNPDTTGKLKDNAVNIVLLVCLCIGKDFKGLNVDREKETESEWEGNTLEEKR